MHDTEHRWAPTTGSVVEMRVIRSALLSIIAACALVAGVPSTANADDGAATVSPTTVAHSTWIATFADPGDPGLPPD
jgi:hypothetical protein